MESNQYTHRVQASVRLPSVSSPKFLNKRKSLRLKLEKCNFRLWNVIFCGICREVLRISMNISKENISSIFRTEEWSKQETSLKQVSSRGLLTCSFKTIVEIQRNTRCYIPEDRILHNHRCENLKSHVILVLHEGVISTNNYVHISYCRLYQKWFTSHILHIGNKSLISVRWTALIWNTSGCNSVSQYRLF
jgi:hypothetical protein